MEYDELSAIFIHLLVFTALNSRFLNSMPFVFRIEVQGEANDLPEAET